MSIKVVVASHNPVKISCTDQAFSKAFPNNKIEVVSGSFPSGVADQPMSDEETLQGAKNRAQSARDWAPDADYWVGIEGGLESKNEEMEAFAWVYILSKKNVGKARTATFQLPKVVCDLINQGIELGEADDIVFKRKNSKQKSGAVGILTKDLIDRSSYYEPAVILALIPFVNIDLY